MINDPTRPFGLELQPFHGLEWTFMKFLRRLFSRPAHVDPDGRPKRARRDHPSGDGTEGGYEAHKQRLRVMLYAEDALPPNPGIFSTVHWPGLLTVLMMESGAGPGSLLRTVQESEVRSWSGVNHAALWAASIEYSIRAESAKVESMAKQGSPDLFVVMSGNRISGTLLGALRLPELRGSRGCIVSYPDKDAFMAHRLDAPSQLDLGRLLHMTRHLGGNPSGTAPVPMWYVHEGGVERFEAWMKDGHPTIKAGPILLAALND